MRWCSLETIKHSTLLQVMTKLPTEPPPSQFICPVSLTIMSDPVLVVDTGKFKNKNYWDDQAVHLVLTSRLYLSCGVHLFQIVYTQLRFCLCFTSDCDCLESLLSEASTVGFDFSFCLLERKSGLEMELHSLRNLWLPPPNRRILECCWMMTIQLLAKPKTEKHVRLLCT